MSISMYGVVKIRIGAVARAKRVDRESFKCEIAMLR
jgi:hypothetical protein